MISQTKGAPAVISMFQSASTPGSLALIMLPSADLSSTTLDSPPLLLKTEAAVVVDSNAFD